MKGSEDYEHNFETALIYIEHFIIEFHNSIISLCLNIHKDIHIIMPHGCR